MDAMTPPAMLAQPTTHDVTIVTTKKLAQARVMGVPPEEFGIERGARSIRDCNYCFHEIVTKTQSQLIDEGFDEDQVMGLEDYTGNTEVETLSRDTVGEHFNTVSASSNKAARLVKVTEHYIRLDYEGNGRACLYQVITAGTQGDILLKDGKPAIAPFDAIPFAATCPVPQPHRFFGRSIADLVMDIQRIKTALVRGMLDNLYLHNNPRVEVAEANAGQNTLDDLLVSRPGGVVRTKTPGGLNWQVVPDITASVYPALQYMDATREQRTGLSQQSQGLDANALQNQSATAVAQVFSASQMRTKLIARIIAEGVKDLFSLLHGTIRKHGQQAQTVRLRNKWIEVDPRQWKTRNDMTINVGLGNGGKAQQFSQTMAIANVQKEMLAGGKSNLVGDKELYNTAAELTRIMGHKNPDKFFNDPDAKDPQTGQLLHPPPQPQPPEAVQVAQIKAQTDQQSMQVQSQLDAQADQRKAQIEATQAQADIATQNEKTKAEMIQSQQDFEFKKQLAVMEFELQRELEREKMAMQRETHLQQMAQQAEQHRQQMEAGVFKVAQGQQAHEQKMEAAKTKPSKPAK